MKARIGRYGCLIIDKQGKLDLFREADVPNQTRMFDSVEEAEAFLSEKGVIHYNVVKIERDTF